MRRAGAPRLAAPSGRSWAVYSCTLAVACTSPPHHPTPPRPGAEIKGGQTAMAWSEPWPAPAMVAVAGGSQESPRAGSCLHSASAAAMWGHGTGSGASPGRASAGAAAPAMALSALSCTDSSPGLPRFDLYRSSRPVCSHLCLSSCRGRGASGSRSLAAPRWHMGSRWATAPALVQSLHQSPAGPKPPRADEGPAESLGSLLEGSPHPRACTQNCTFFPIHRTMATPEHSGGCVGAQHPAQLPHPPTPPPQTARASRIQGHGSPWHKSLRLPLSCPGDTAQSPKAPQPLASSLGMLGPPPGSSTGFRYMERPHLPVSRWGWSWLRCDHSLPRSLHGREHRAAATRLLPGVPCSQSTGQRVLSGASSEERQAKRSFCSISGWLLGPNILARPLKTEEIREQKELMETPGPDDALILGNLPNSLTALHPCPTGCSPLPQTLCQGLYVAPSFHPTRHCRVHRLLRFLPPTSACPQVCKRLLFPSRSSPAAHSRRAAAAQLPNLKPQRRSFCSGSPRARQPRSRRKLLLGRSRSRVGRGHPHSSPEGLQGKQYPRVNIPVRPADLEMQPRRFV